MDPITPYEALIAVANCPSLLISEGKVICANDRAIECGFLDDSARDLLTPNILRNLSNIREGQLHIHIQHNGLSYSATISRSGPYDLYYISREFDGPQLNTLSATAGTLKNSLSRVMIAAGVSNTSDPELQRSLHQLQRVIYNMEDATSFNKKRSSQTEACDITSFFDKLMGHLSQKLSRANITLEYNRSDRHVICLVDKERLERGIMNLIANAISYHVAPLTLKAELHCYSGHIHFSVRSIAGATSKYERICSDYNNTIETILPNSDLALGITIAKGAAFAHNGALTIDQPNLDSIRLSMVIPMVKAEGKELRSPVHYPMDYTGGYDHILVEFSYILPPELYT